MTAEGQFRLSVVISTFNRCTLLPNAIRSLYVQPPAVPQPSDSPSPATASSYPFEVIVVDNGCTDATPEVVEQLRAEGLPVRRVVETRKGVAYTRNAGVAASTAPYIALMDDDQEAYPGWADAIIETLDARPDLAFLAGPIELMWVGRPVDWITPAIQGAVTVIEWGNEPRPIDADHWMCVAGGNGAYRRDVVNALGGWRPFRRSQDREFTVRLLLAGYRGLYVPSMRMRHRVNGDRLNRDYFRKWNATEGRMRAGYQFEELFDADGRIHPPVQGGRRLAGVPLYLYRRAFGEMGAYVRSLVRRSRNEAFEHELKLRYLWNYILARMAGPTRT